MEISAKVFTLMENLVVLANIIGQMVAILKAYLKMVCEMDKVYGSEAQAIVINMKENMSMIKNQDMEYLHGPPAMYTKETIRMILEMGMDKCTGMMEAITKDTGRMVSNMDKDKYMFLDKDSKKECLKIMY